MRCERPTASGQTSYTTSTVPPAAVILEAAVEEKACALTCRATDSSPFPRTFTGVLLRARPASTRASGSTPPPLGKAAASRSRFTTDQATLFGRLRPRRGPCGRARSWRRERDAGDAASLGNLLHLHQVGDLEQHAADLRAVLMLDHVVHPLQTQ